MARGVYPSGKDRTGPVFEARFDSTCGSGDLIDEGEEIVMYDGDAYHVECAEIHEGLEVPNR